MSLTLTGQLSALYLIFKNSKTKKAIPPTI